MLLYLLNKTYIKCILEVHINTFQYISNSNIQDWIYWLPADTILKELQIIYISLRNSSYFLMMATLKLNCMFSDFFALKVFLDTHYSCVYNYKVSLWFQMWKTILLGARWYRFDKLLRTLFFFLICGDTNPTLSVSPLRTNGDNPPCGLYQKVCDDENAYKCRCLHRSMLLLL